MSEREIIIDKIAKIAREYNLSKVWIFGSYARDEQTEGSDIDILVETSDVEEGFKIVEVKHAIEDEIGKYVDIVTTGSIKGSLLEDEELNEILVYSED